MNNLKRLIILGSTGSVGSQALDVVRQHRDRFDVVGLSAASNAQVLREQAREFEPDFVALENGDVASLDGIAAEKIVGEGAAARLAEVQADTLLNGVVGFAGLASTVNALQAGTTVALANKESLVTGGDWVMKLAARAGNPILPVDSEHSAIFQCLEGRAEDEITGILLTASGGPFFGLERYELEGVGPESALKHPTWRMGAKITIDSATLMNKGLEVIEAHHLFDVPFDAVKVVVHRQSVVHGGAILKDGSVVVHAALPDMRLPIAFGILHPRRVDVQARPVPFDAATWTFEEPNGEVFRCLPLAIEAGRLGGAYPVALNAANEVAVRAFLDRRIEFLEIAEVVEEVLDSVPESGSMQSLEEITAADKAARKDAEHAVQGRVR